jgi:glucose/arabinose dehydrogenase
LDNHQQTIVIKMFQTARGFIPISYSIVLVCILLMALQFLPAKAYAAHPTGDFTLPHAPPLSTQAVTLPTGFAGETIVSGLSKATAFAFTGDGRIFIAFKNGFVRVWQNGALLPGNFIDLSSEVNNVLDRGLLGMALHPNFPNPPYVYLLYVYDPPGVNADGGGARVSRLIRVSAYLTDTNVADPSSKTVILGKNSTFANIGNPNWLDDFDNPACGGPGARVDDCIAADYDSHSVGRVMFAPDGSLFLSNGDNSSYYAPEIRALRSQDLNSLSGKIMRIDPDSGNGYADNPFYDGDPTHNRSRIWSYGLRNPFRFTLHPTTSQIYIGDVGWNAWEELNMGRGKNFGWPCYEGGDGTNEVQPDFATYTQTAPTCAALYATPSATQASIYGYWHGDGSRGAIIAGTIYSGTTFPITYQNTLFFADYTKGWIKYVTFSPTGSVTINNFASGILSSNGGPVQVSLGPDSNLYYLIFDYTITGAEIGRIRYIGSGNFPPTALINATPTNGGAPLTVTFSAAASSDPDGQPLTFLWNFGDGYTSTFTNPVHTYAITGTYTVVLTVTDSLSATNSARVSISAGNHAPVPTILTPTNGLTYHIGTVISFNGIVSDAEQSAFPSANMEWEVVLHHADHVHPNYYQSGGTSGSFTVTDHGDNTWLELCLTATDGGGLKGVTCVDLLPQLTRHTFQTEPSGLNIVYDAVSQPTPLTAYSIVSGTRQIATVSPQNNLAFRAWSDGGASSHTIIIGANPLTLTAYYSPYLTINNVTVTEGNAGQTNAVFAVTLSTTSSQTITVAYNTTNGTATGGSDYIASASVITFTPNVTATKYITIQVNGDALYESDETFFVNLTSAVALSAQGTGTILNDDTTPPSLTLSNASGNEGDIGTRTLTFTVTLSPASGVTATVAYSTTNGSALVGSDYLAASGTLTFAPNVTTQLITITIMGDTLVEPSETFSVTVSNPISATLPITQAVGTILNDDQKVYLPLVVR